MENIVAVIIGIAVFAVLVGGYVAISRAFDRVSAERDSWNTRARLSNYVGGHNRPGVN